MEDHARMRARCEEPAPMHVCAPSKRVRVAMGRCARVHVCSCAHTCARQWASAGVRERGCSTEDTTCTRITCMCMYLCMGMGVCSAWASHADAGACAVQEQRRAKPGSVSVHMRACAYARTCTGAPRSVRMSTDRYVLGAHDAHDAHVHAWLRACDAGTCPYMPVHARTCTYMHAPYARMQ